MAFTKIRTSKVSEFLGFECMDTFADKAPPAPAVANTTSCHPLQQCVGVPVSNTASIHCV